LGLTLLLGCFGYTPGTQRVAQAAQSADETIYYTNDFEAREPLKNWTGQDDLWTIVDDDERGSTLQGIGARGIGLNTPLIVQGKETPDWLERTDLVIGFSFNVLGSNDQSGARIFFRASDEGYYVLEFFPGTVTFKTGKGSLAAGIDRPTESRIGNVRRQLETDTREWHDVLLWVSEPRLYIYIDNRLAAHFENIYPILPAGQIALQAIGNEPVRFDDVVVQKAITGSLHFSGQGLPAEYTYADRSKTGLEFDPNTGDQFLRINGANTITDVYVPDNFSFHCRIRNDGYAYKLWLRQSNEGRVVVGPDVSGFTVLQVFDGEDTLRWEWKPERNVPFHGLNRWADVAVILIGDHLRIVVDSNIRFDDRLPFAPETGDFAIATTETGDRVGLDDCLLLEAVGA
jgi:hypothetical protein